MEIPCDQRAAERPKQEISKNADRNGDCADGHSEHQRGFGPLCQERQRPGGNEDHRHLEQQARQAVRR